jgi:hypothetical protein
MAPTVVYLAGYAGEKPETLWRGMIALGATVIDVRHVPRSSRPEWARARLEATLEGRYLWLPEWGNVNAGQPGAPISLSNIEAGMAKFEALEGPIILLCRCSNFQWDEYGEEGLF